MDKIKAQEIVLPFICLMFVTFTFASNKTLEGKVTTFDSIPLVVVDIVVKSTG